MFFNVKTKRTSLVDLRQQCKRQCNTDRLLQETPMICAKGAEFAEQQNLLYKNGSGNRPCPCKPHHHNAWILLICFAELLWVIFIAFL